MTDVLASDPQAKITQALEWIGKGLVVLAVIVLFVGRPSLDGAAYTAGTLLGQGFFVGGIAWLCVRHRGQRARAWAWAAVGVILLGLSAGEALRFQGDKRAAESFRQDVGEVYRSSSMDLAVIDSRIAARFNSISQLQPSTLASASTRSDAMTQLKALSDDLDGRQASVDAVHEKFKSIGSRLPQAQRASFFENYEASYSKTKSQNAKVRSGLVAYIEEMRDLLSWGEKQSGLSLSPDGQLMIPTSQGLQEFNDRAKRVGAAQEAASLAWNEAAQAATAAQARANEVLGTN